MLKVPRNEDCLLVMMFLLAFILYYTSSYSSGSAAPVNSLLNFDNSNSTSLFPSIPEAQDLCPRTRLDITWSCLATVLASSWVSVHPNLPHPHDSKLKKMLRRMELMLWAILTPELIIYWAMRQWYGARQMEREYSSYIGGMQVGYHSPKSDAVYTDHQQDEGSKNSPSSCVTPGTAETDHERRSNTLKLQRNDFKWTKAHGFFLQMGGFVLHQNGKKNCVLGWEHLMAHYKAGQIDLSDVTEASINDHSKADGFAKGFALLQSSWFIIQCIVRLASDDHLALTELELVTAALAALSFVMYFLWWNKPFNAEIPIVIDISSSQSPGPSCNDTEHKYQLDNNGGKSHFMDIKNVLWIIKRMVQNIFDISLMEHGYAKTSGQNHSQQTTITKVPTFYSVAANSALDLYKMLWASLSIAVLFGGIHCVGWSSKIRFSSHPISLLWRTSSTIITASPIFWSLDLAFTYAYTKPNKADSFSKTVFAILWKIFAFLTISTIPLYVASRAILLLIAFVELRNAPPDALLTFQWANFLPYIH